MLSRRKIALIGLIGVLLCCVGAFCFKILPEISATYRKQTSELQRMNASQFLASSDELDDVGVELTGLQIVGKPAVKKRSARYFKDYVLIKSDQEEDDRLTCLIARPREKTEASLVEMIETGTLSGILRRDPFNELDQEKQDFLLKNFPDVDFEETAIFWHRDFAPSWLGWIVWGMLAIQIPNLAYLSYLLFKKEPKQPWQDAIDNDRTEIYRQNQKAMRLIGNDSFSDGSLRHRSVDSDFDVAPVKEVKHRKPKQVMHYVLALAVYFAAVVWIKGQIRDSEWLANIDSLWLELGMMLPLAFGYSVLSATTKSSATGRGEEEIDRDKASYRNNEFHQYHHRVLNELGFIEVGDFKQIGSPAKLTRTIYLSPNGNLLLEIGTQTGRDYFTLESLTNGGKFLETHSMVPQRLELRNESKVHQRRAADHQDIIKALETHDELVSEFTFAGSSHEAKFTEENFPRFLAYPSVKKLS